MRRERLMSGQRWYFDEDGTSVTLDLVVDIWSGVKETSQVMIGGLWYDEETVQQMMSGRRNSFYEFTGDTWCYDYVSSDVKTVYKVVDYHLYRNKSIDDVVTEAVSDLTGNDGIGVTDNKEVINIGGVNFFIRSIAIARRYLIDHVTAF